MRLDIRKSCLQLTTKPFFGILRKTQKLVWHTPSQLQALFVKSPHTWLQHSLLLHKLLLRYTYDGYQGIFVLFLFKWSLFEIFFKLYFTTL